MRKIFVSLLIVSSLYAENVGQQVAAFEIPMLESKPYQYSDAKLKNRVVLINFWATWCPSCKKEMPLLENLAKKFQKRPFKVLAINMDRKKALATKFVKKFKDDRDGELNMVMLYDKEKKLFKKHPARGYPYTLLVKDGMIVADYLGSFDEQSIKSLENKIEKLLH